MGTKLSRGNFKDPVAAGFCPFNGCQVRPRKGVGYCFKHHKMANRTGAKTGRTADNDIANMISGMSSMGVSESASPPVRNLPNRCPSGGRADHNRGGCQLCMRNNLFKQWGEENASLPRCTKHGQIIKYGCKNCAANEYAGNVAQMSRRGKASLRIQRDARRLLATRRVARRRLAKQRLAQLYVNRPQLVNTKQRTNAARQRFKPLRCPPIKSAVGNVGPRVGIPQQPSVVGYVAPGVGAMVTQLNNVNREIADLMAQLNGLKVSPKPNSPKPPRRGYDKKRKQPTTMRSMTNVERDRRVAICSNWSRCSKIASNTGKMCGGKVVTHNNGAEYADKVHTYRFTCKQCGENHGNSSVGRRHLHNTRNWNGNNYGNGNGHGGWTGNASNHKENFWNPGVR